MRFRLLQFVFLLAFSGGAALAQENSAPILDVQLHRGLLLQADRNMLHLTNTAPVAAEIRYQAAGGNLQHYPRLKVGGTLGYYRYQHPHLGSSLAAFPWLRISLFQKSKFEADLQLGAGAAWHSKPYHAVENNLNNVLGSSLTAALQLKTGITYSVGKRMLLQAGLAFTHFSNGGSAMPNKGLNLMSAWGGIGYRFSARNHQPEQEERLQEDTGWQYQFTVSGGRQQMKFVNSGFHTFFNATVAAYKPKNVKGGFLLGGDLFYNPGLKTLLKRMQESESTEPDYYRAGLFAGYLMQIERLSILAQLGYYVYRPYDVYQPVYQRYGLRFRLTEYLFASAALKAHFGEAEAVEWGIGISL